MNRFFALFLIVIAAMTSLTACGGNEVSWDTQEASRQAALDNSEHNARVFRDANMPEAKLKLRGDSTIAKNCASGDGWASVDLINASGQTVRELKCSTVSGTIGCMTSVDFKARPNFASQEGRCNTDLPFPLPKVAK